MRYTAKRCVATTLTIDNTLVAMSNLVRKNIYSALTHKITHNGLGAVSAVSYITQQKVL